MLLNKEKIDKIKQIIARNYYALLVTATGRDVFSEDELKELEGYGVDTTKASLLSLIYYHNILNAPDSTLAPTTVKEMEAQQQGKPEKLVYKAAEEHLNESLAQATEKLSETIQDQFEAIIRQYNLDLRNKVLVSGGNERNELTVSELKTALRDITHDATRDWRRIAITETSNAIGMGSVDRLVAMNEGKDPESIYVYRIPVNDAALCKFCRSFYLDADGTPAVYKLSTILGNGTNYGKKQLDWKPVAGATHPNERCSGLLELKPNWKVAVGGKLEFIGPDAWTKYINGKLKS